MDELGAGVCEDVVPRSLSPEDLRLRDVSSELSQVLMGRVTRSNHEYRDTALSQRWAGR